MTAPSETKAAVRERVRRHRARKQEQAESEAVAKANELQYSRHREVLEAEFGAEAVWQWMLANKCGDIALQLQHLFIEGEAWDEVLVQNSIDLMDFMDVDYRPHPSLIPTRWREYEAFGERVARLGFAILPKPGHVREFFTDWYNCVRWHRGLPVLVATPKPVEDFRRDWTVSPEQVKPPAPEHAPPKPPAPPPQLSVQPTVAQILGEPAPPKPMYIGGFCIGSSVRKRGGASTVLKITGFHGEDHAVCEFTDEDNGEVVDGLILPLASLEKANEEVNTPLNGT